MNTNNNTATNSTTNSSNVTQYAQKSGKKRIFDKNEYIHVWNLKIPNNMCVGLFLLLFFEKLGKSSFQGSLYLSREPWKPLFRGIPEIQGCRCRGISKTAISHFRQNADSRASSPEGSWMLPEAENRLEMHGAAR
jgi:hypothetical protein